MTHQDLRRRLAVLAMVLLPLAGGAATVGRADDAGFNVAVTDVDDQKAVYGVIRSKDRIDARVRTPGTIASLSVTEGMKVTAGEVLAVVVDDKIALHLRSLDAQIAGLASAEEKAKADLDRALTLKKQNLVAQANVDQLASTHDVAANALKSAEADRDVQATQLVEGEVKAPANGRVLSVPVTVGSVVMAGESIATIAANDYVVRLELPERHARFIREGDTISIGARGLDPASSMAGTGHITLVHPEVQNGLVIADAEATGLGDFFVGERALVWISAGKRRAIVIPSAYVMKRGGFDFVRLAAGNGPPLDIVVQVGRAIDSAGAQGSVEILGGLAAGDHLVKP